MAAISTQFATPAITQSEGLLFVHFSDGSNLEFDSPTGLQNWVLGRLPDLDGVRAIAIANRMAQDPLLDTPAIWDGKTATLDVEQATPGNVFKVV